MAEAHVEASTNPILVHETQPDRDITDKRKSHDDGKKARKGGRKAKAKAKADKDKRESDRKRRHSTDKHGRGGVLSAIHEASMTLVGAQADVLSEILSSYRERYEESVEDNDNHWIFDMGKNVTNALWDGFEHASEIPRQVRDAYRDERDYDPDEA
ncbi:hypothetical protein G6O69_22890 [Pseudenhygromyxa sp. WMMC2535]|uniref:hypothetical protein n=1 Tax=Pseudenhygromyxa sp. WMMC2535 TaxID=2712867 RepID=UPI00155188BB|nr:hypothetical protein [Pseudenhygromyxa sp. WMMC2535]NVB40704.1 hypothetical protein [Pseudenhygromyxa sp. WMMC2535]